MTSRLYWIGLYQECDSKRWEWFFQVDLAPAISYCTKRIVAAGKLSHVSGRVVLVLVWTNEHTALWLLFFNNNLFIISLDGSVSGLVAGLLDCLPSPMSAGAKFGIFFGIMVFVLGFQYCLGALVCVITSNVDGPDLLL